MFHWDLLDLVHPKFLVDLLDLVDIKFLFYYLSLWSFLSSLNLTSLQNSTELTKSFKWTCLILILLIVGWVFARITIYIIVTVVVISLSHSSICKTIRVSKRCRYNISNALIKKNKIIELVTNI